MKTSMKEVNIRELTSGYVSGTSVTAYGGLLNIRPAYQREFVYNDKQRTAVVTSVLKGLPISLMYWVDLEDGRFEVLDGQQRTMSICQYVNGEFAVDDMFFENLPMDEQNEILEYKLLVSVCVGNGAQKLEWFETINTAGAILKAQELRNAAYTGPWLSSAKTYFSTSAVMDCGGHLLKGTLNRQDILEKVLQWVSNGGKPELYMAKHQHDNTADALIEYFENIVDWVDNKFPTKRKEMKGVNWGSIHYNNKNNFDKSPAQLDEEVAALMADEDVTKKANIFEYVLTGKESLLSIRAFTAKAITEQFNAQHGVCCGCGDTFTAKEMHADHIEPWSKGGKTTKDNLQMLCISCNLKKSDK